MTLPLRGNNSLAASLRMSLAALTAGLGLIATLPAYRISALHESVDLIIIATHGYTGLKHIQLGSTAEMIVRYAPCPVLVLPNRSRAEGVEKEA